MTAAVLELPAPGEILSLLGEQRDLCRRLSGFAQMQRSLITGDEPERLLALLGDRQQVLDRLTVVGERLRPVQKRWAEIRPLFSAADGRVADELVTEVNRLLAGILQNDETDAQLLSARKSTTGQAAQQVGRGRQVGVAYAAASGGSPMAAQVDWTDQ